jgi:hypothetical protein
MEKQKMLEFLKGLVFDLHYGRKSREQIVHELSEDISPSDEIPNSSNEEKLIFNLYWDLHHLTHDPPFHTRDVEIEYYMEVFKGTRKYSDEDVHNYWVEKGIGDVYKLP